MDAAREREGRSSDQVLIRAPEGGRAVHRRRHVAGSRGGAKKTLGGVLPERVVVLTGSVLVAFAAFRWREG
jgi:hypothetical protein